jgi:hypothetical protein
MVSMVIRNVARDSSTGWVGWKGMTICPNVGPVYKQRVYNQTTAMSWSADHLGR